MRSRVGLALNGLGAVLLGWLYVGDALDAVRSRSAQVSAYLEPPNLTFALLALLATAAAIAALGWGVYHSRASGWRGYRLMPIVAVVVLFVDLFILTAARSPLTSADRTALTLRSFVDAANAAATLGQVPKIKMELQAMVDVFGPPAYRVQGVPVKAWAVVVRERCLGPVTAIDDEPVGTLFYCLAEDRKTAWVSAVALPVGTYLGAPALFTRGGEVISGVVNAKVADEPPAESAP